MQYITSKKFNQKYLNQALNQEEKAASASTQSLLAAVIEAIKNKKGENIISLNLENIDEAVAKYFIVCDAQTHIQTEAIVNNIVDEVMQETNEKPYHIEKGQVWSIIDYADVVVHVFRTEDRKFYDLEGVWMDAPQKEYA